MKKNINPLLAAELFVWGGMEGVLPFHSKKIHIISGHLHPPISRAWHLDLRPQYNISNVKLSLGVGVALRNREKPWRNPGFGGFDAGP